MNQATRSIPPKSDDVLREQPEQPRTEPEPNVTKLG
jgi:hypothetical protein